MRIYLREHLAREKYLRQQRNDGNRQFAVHMSIFSNDFISMFKMMEMMAIIKDGTVYNVS